MKGFVSPHLLFETVEVLYSCFIFVGDHQQCEREANDCESNTLVITRAEVNFNGTRHIKSTIIIQVVSGTLPIIFIFYFL